MYLKNYVINAIRGFCMALADSVPGVSGGTIAFILGFYDKFINSLDDLLFGSWDKKKEAIKFIIKLGIGWLVGIILAVLVLTSLFENHIYAVSSLFMGFIIFSIPLIIKEEKDSLKGKYGNLVFLVIGIVIVALITYFNPVGSDGPGFDISHITLGSALYMFVAAAVAISAMVLPGISGSTLMLIFGLYIPLITSIKALIHFDFTYLPAIITMLLGVVAGIAAVIRLIKIALKKYRSATIYAIIGLMIGSIYAIVMGPTTLEVALPAMSFETFNIIMFIVGGVVVFGLEKLKDFLEKK